MENQKVLLFAGTTEGRLLFNDLNEKGISVDACVATEYGKEVIEENSDNIFAKRLDIDEMQELIHNNGYNIVIDATHPYATLVTQNIKSVCDLLQVQYIRLLRKESEYSDVIYCENINEAVEFLSQNDGNVLSTIGSKELNFLTELDGYEKRVFARILPLPDAVNSCFKLGFKGSNLICMQGPFSYELNLAMLKQYDCRYLLTKNSGNVGGFDEKIKAAKDANAKVILIGRPTNEKGLSIEQVKNLFENNLCSQQNEKIMLKTFFPLFVDISKKNILVVGAGKIATRRIETLVKFDCKIKVVAKSATDEVLKLAKLGLIDFQQREFVKEDIDNIFLAVAATNNREVNHYVGSLAKENNIYVSVADCKEECTFFFPAVIETKDTVIGLTAEGKSHKAASKMADKIRSITKFD